MRVETAYVPMPSGLDEHQEAVWIDGFKAGVNWLHQKVNGSENAFPIVDEEVVSLDTDSDGNPIL